MIGLQKYYYIPIYPILSKIFFLDNFSLCPFTSSRNVSFSYTKCPDTMVWVIFERNCIPSKGDQPHLERMFSLLTVQGLSKSTKTRSAWNPGRINPRLSISKINATLCAAFYAICSNEIFPWWYSSNRVTRLCCTSGPPDGAVI